MGHGDAKFLAEGHTARHWGREGRYGKQQTCGRQITCLGSK